MKRIVLSSLVALCLPLAASAENKQFHSHMAGTSEVPAISTTASGTFLARISADGSAISFQLSYDELEGDVTQAHIHIGQSGVNGGVALFLCSNLGTPGVQPCPVPPATVSGILTAADVIGPASQGVAAGEFAEVVAAIRAGVAYANVHSTKFPGGEIRAQVDSGAP